MLDYSPPLASGTLEDQSDLRRSAEEGKPLILARLAIASKRADFNVKRTQTIPASTRRHIFSGQLFYIE
jgi:hypothetical protein